jgi:hypothetical protein
MTPKDLLLDEAYKVFVLAKAGNMVSAAVFNEWAASNEMPLLPDPEYDTVTNYDKFYNLAYMNNFID